MWDFHKNESVTSNLKSEKGSLLRGAHLCPQREFRYYNRTSGHSWSTIFENSFFKKKIEKQKKWTQATFEIIFQIVSRCLVRRDLLRNPFFFRKNLAQETAVLKTKKVDRVKSRKKWPVRKVDRVKSRKIDIFGPVLEYFLGVLPRHIGSKPCSKTIAEVQRGKHAAAALGQHCDSAVAALWQCCGSTVAALWERAVTALRRRGKHRINK